MHFRSLTALLAAAAVAACASESAGPAEAPALASASTARAVISPVLDSVNQALISGGSGFNLGKAEFLLANKPGFDAAGQVIFANDRALRLPYRWVPGDPRRNSVGTEITYLNVDPLMFANDGVGVIDATDAVNSSFDTWAGLQCSTVELAEVPWDGTFNPSAILNLGLPSDPVQASINTIGFIPPFFFDLILGAGASENVLGVTFTFYWINPDGSPTDINADGYLDTAFKEVWYNDGFVWTTSGLADDGIDIETVALHENGHALELAHFGKIFGTLGNLRLHVAPRAVMNAAILGTLRSPLGTDNGAFCGVWADWPS